MSASGQNLSAQALQFYLRAPGPRCGQASRAACSRRRGAASLPASAPVGAPAASARIIGNTCQCALENHMPRPAHGVCWTPGDNAT